MNFKYHIIGAHSGTSKEEAEKAKRYFRKQVKENKTWAHLTKNIHIRFEDMNFEIRAYFRNQYGEKVCDFCQI